MPFLNCAHAGDHKSEPVAWWFRAALESASLPGETKGEVL